MPAYCLFAGVHVVHPDALLTADVAAPVENTVALLFAFLSPSVVTSAAAKEVAAVDAVGCQVARSVTSPEGAGLRVGVAEVGRVFVIDQVALCGGFEVVVLGSQCLDPAPGLAVFLHHHLRGAVVLVLHVVPDHSEVGLRPPAGFDLTAARQTVALTLEEHVVIHGYSPSLVVVPVHGRACVRAVLPSVSKLPGHHAAELHILAAAAPLPAFSGRAFVARITPTDGG